MPLKGEKYFELFHMFSELHKTGGVEDEQDRALPCFFTVGFLNTILVPETDKVLKYPLYPGDFIRWVGCWLYRDHWVNIP